MLSKPKYMLPGNLSQGVPVLEPDENGKYKFSFALDGDEIIEKYRYKIYSLEPLELAKEDIKLSFNDFYIKEETTNDSGETIIKNVSLINYIKLIHIEAVLDDERNINFLAKFTFPKNEIVYINKEKYPQSNFLLPNYTGSISFNFNITVNKWGLLMYKNNSKTFGSYASDWWTPLLNIFKDEGKSNKFSNLIFTGVSKLKFIKSQEDGLIGFISDTDEISGNFTISYNDFYKEQIKTKPYITINEKKYHQWAEERYHRFLINLENGESFNYDKEKYYNKVLTVEGTYAYYLNVYYYDYTSKNKYYPYTENFPGDSEHRWIDFEEQASSVFFSKGYWTRTPIGFLFEFAPYTDNYYAIESTSLEINLKKSEQNLFLEEEFFCNEMPKNQKGQYNFFVFEINKFLSGASFDDGSGLAIPSGHYCWGVEILKKDSFNEYKIIAASNYYHFDILENKKNYGLSTNKAPEVSIYINDIIDNSPYLLDYCFELSNAEILFYKSPWINSNNSTIIFPFKFFPFKIKYITTFTSTDLEQKILLEDDFFYSLRKYNKLIEFNQEDEKIFLKADKEIKNLSIFRTNKNNNRIIFIKKISLESNTEIKIDDIGNNFSEYYYYLVNDDTGEWQYSQDKTEEETGEIKPVYYLNKNLDRWRLILTKGEKNDIIEEKRMCHYQIDKIYDFYYNLVSGSISNNAETVINTNFTEMPSVQKGFSNYWSGSLSALMGVCNAQGDFMQTVDQEKALEQLVLDQEHDKFLLDREGNIWQIEISTPLTIANQDGLVQINKLIDLKTITISWVQIGAPTQIMFDFEE